MNGQCLCGSARYELLTQFHYTYYCHCKDCQRISGSAFQVLGAVPNDAVNLLKDNLAAYIRQTDSGFEMTREFCPTCSSALFLSSTQFPDIRMVNISSLDAPESITPEFEIWCDSRVSWSTISKELSSYPDPDPKPMETTMETTMENTMGTHEFQNLIARPFFCSVSHCVTS